MALQTVRGDGSDVAKTGMHPAELKDRVTSPGGTTIAGVAQLEQAGFRSALIAAVQAAKSDHRNWEVSTRQRGVADFHRSCPTKLAC